ncbi:hypothetical protein ABZ619_09390 [Streptomyces sp. NPDC007851]|uniref:hypothetical protein n=1 Tax=Streptomyces sp. NPDC007851 TaxID=3155008 RepID=UPI0033E819C4
MERAAALLLATDWTVAAIGVAVGARSMRTGRRTRPPHVICASLAAWRWPMDGRGTARFEKTQGCPLPSVGCRRPTEERP